MHIKTPLLFVLLLILFGLSVFGVSSQTPTPESEPEVRLLLYWEEYELTLIVEELPGDISLVDLQLFAMVGGELVPIDLGSYFYEFNFYESNDVFAQVAILSEPTCFFLVREGRSGAPSACTALGDPTIEEFGEGENLWYSTAFGKHDIVIQRGDKSVVCEADSQPPCEFVYTVVVPPTTPTAIDTPTPTASETPIFTSTPTIDPRCVPSPGQPDDVVLVVPELGLFMDRFEVSNEAFNLFLECDGYTNLSYWDEAGQDWLEAEDVIEPVSAKDRPALFPRTNITIYGARAYCRFRGKYLPSAEEWRLAATSIVPDDANLNDNTMVRANETSGETANAIGLYHMFGNAAEWVDSEDDLGHSLVLGGSHRSNVNVEEIGNDVSILDKPPRPGNQLQLDIGFRCAWRP